MKADSIIKNDMFIVYSIHEGIIIVVKMGTDGLKITKTSFRKTLKYLLTEKKIA